MMGIPDDLEDATIKIVLQIGKTTYSVETLDWDLNIGEVMTGLVRPLLLAAGFTEQSLEEVIPPP